MHFTDDLGTVYTSTSVWSIDCSKNETTDQMRCFISHRHFDGLTCLRLTRLATVDVSISHIIVVGRTKLECPSHFRYSPFPSAPHPAVSNDAVEVKLTTIDCRSGNLTRIALQLARAHHYLHSQFFFKVKKYLFDFCALTLVISLYEISSLIYFTA